MSMSDWVVGLYVEGKRKEKGRRISEDRDSVQKYSKRQQSQETEVRVQEHLISFFKMTSLLICFKIQITCASHI